MMGNTYTAESGGSEILAVSGLYKNTSELISVVLRSFLTSKSLSVLQPCLVGYNSRYVATLRYAVIAVFKKHFCLAYLYIHIYIGRKAVGRQLGWHLTCIL